jgi:hypothetical protein
MQAEDAITMLLKDHTLVKKFFVQAKNGQQAGRCEGKHLQPDKSRFRSSRCHRGRDLLSACKTGPLKTS